MPKVSDYHLAERRRHILDGARRCFAKYGYTGATVRRLEEATELSRGAIFHHFRDKEALFLALADEDARRMATVAAEHGLVQVMRNIIARPQDFNWLSTRLEVARKIRTDTDFRNQWHTLSAELDSATLSRLKELRNKGRLRDDLPPEVLVSYLNLIMDGLLNRLATGESTTKLEEVLDLVEISLRCPAPTG